MLKGKVFVSVVLTGMITGCGAVTSNVPRGSSAAVSHVPMTRPEEIIVTHKLPADHVTFLELDDGRILMCNFADMKHKGGAATPGFSISSDGGETWGEQYQGREKSGKEFDFNCGCLVKLSAGRIGLATLQRESDSSSHMVFRTSDDLGRTWSEPVITNKGMLPAHAYQDVMLRTESGRIILPVYFAMGQSHQKGAPWHFTHGGFLNGNFVGSGPHTADPRFGASYVLYSDDEGKTWQKNSDGELLILTDYGGPFEIACEPSVAEVEPGKLLMILRTRLGRMFQSWSYDNGETWSRPKPTLLAGAQHPAQIRKIPGTGHLLVVWAQHDERELRQGYMRTRLSSAISRDGGVTWEHFQNIDSIHKGAHLKPGPIRIYAPEPTYPTSRSEGAPEFDPEYSVPMLEGYGSRSYPSVLVTKDRALIFYSYQHYSSTGDYICEARLKVLPVSWFYGGEDQMKESFILDKIRKAREKREKEEEHSGKG